MSAGPSVWSDNGRPAPPTTAWSTPSLSSSSTRTRPSRRAARSAAAQPARSAEAGAGPGPAAVAQLLLGGPESPAEAHELPRPGVRLAQLHVEGPDVPDRTSPGGVGAGPGRGAGQRPGPPAVGPGEDVGRTAGGQCERGAECGEIRAVRRGRRLELGRAERVGVLLHDAHPGPDRPSRPRPVAGHGPQLGLRVPGLHPVGHRPPPARARARGPAAGGRGGPRPPAARAGPARPAPGRPRSSTPSRSAGGRHGGPACGPPRRPASPCRPSGPAGPRTRRRPSSPAARPAGTPCGPAQPPRGPHRSAPVRRSAAASSSAASASVTALP